MDKAQQTQRDPGRSEVSEGESLKVRAAAYSDLHGVLSEIARFLVDSSVRLMCRRSGANNSPIRRMGACRGVDEAAVPSLTDTFLKSSESRA